MDIFFNLLKKGLVMTFLIVFAFVITYSPISNIENVQAVDVVHDPVSFTQMIEDFGLQTSQLAEQAATNISTTFSASVDALTEGKEFGLDAAAWTIAKQALNVMREDMLDWINSGFEGRPMFVEDMSSYLTELGDRVFNEYINEIGGPASFLCEPFRLDIQIALSLEYQNSDRPELTCTLTGVIDNIEGFIEGSQGSFSQGGWNDWIDITSNPGMYTPYGAEMSARGGLDIGIRNAKNDEVKLIDRADGFLSTKKCKDVEAGGTTKQICSVVTPGKTISEALNGENASEKDSLIAADEIDEIVIALFNQLASKAVISAQGLLGS